MRTIRVHVVPWLLLSSPPDRAPRGGTSAPELRCVLESWGNTPHKRSLRGSDIPTDLPVLPSAESTPDTGSQTVFVVVSQPLA